MYDDTMTAEQAIATANTVAAKMEKWALQTQQRAEAQTGRAGYAWARARRMRALAQWALGESHIVDAFVRQRDLGLAIGAAQLLDVVATAEAEALAEAGFSDDDDATLPPVPFLPVTKGGPLDRGIVVLLMDQETHMPHAVWATFESEWEATIGKAMQHAIDMHDPDHVDSDVSYEWQKQPNSYSPLTSWIDAKEPEFGLAIDSFYTE